MCVQNLIGLEHYGSQNQTWHQLTAAMSNLSSIRCLEFGPCPANLLYAAADKMPHLDSLVAESIMDMSCDYNTTKRLVSLLALINFNVILTLLLPMMRICVNFFTVCNDTLVVQGLNSLDDEDTIVGLMWRELWV